MKNDNEKFQHQLLEKMHKLGCAVDMELSVWRPDKKHLSHLIHQPEFDIKLNPAGGIFTLTKGDDAAVVFCNHTDDDYVKEEINKRKEVDIK